MSSPPEGDAYGLRWNNGVGILPGSTLKFRMNEFGMLAVIRDAGDNLASYVSGNRNTIASESTSPRAPPRPSGEHINVETTPHMAKSPAASAAIRATASKPTSAPLPGRGRQATVSLNTSASSIESSSANAASRATGLGGQVRLQQPKQSSKTARTGERAHHSMSLKAVPLMQSNAEQNRPTFAHLGRDDGENIRAASTSSVSYPLLPGATALFGRKFLSAQSIFDLLSDPKVRKAAVRTIPTGPKVNCFFVVNVGAELTDYRNRHTNLIRINAQCFDGTGAWGHHDQYNRERYIFSNEGTLKRIDKLKNNNTPYDLRLHRSSYREFEHVEGDQPAKRSICWFFNAERAPAPGFVVVSYLGSPYVQRPPKHSPNAPAPITQSTNKLKENSASNLEDDWAPATKRRSRENEDWEPSRKVAVSAGSGRTQSTYNLKSRTSTPVVVISDSESESSEDREEECSRSTLNESSGSSSSASRSLAAGKRRLNSSGTPTSSPATATNRKSIASESTSPRAPLPTRGRQAIANAETSQIKSKSQTANVLSRTTGSDGQLRRPQQKEASKTARTGELAKLSMSFEALLQKQSNAEWGPPTPDRLGHDAGENGEAASTSSMAYPLLPGATALTGHKFLSAQSLFDILSDPKVRKRAVHTIPNGPKVNCFFVVNIGAELTDLHKYQDNLLRIRFKLRERSGVWDYKTEEDCECYTVSDSGILNSVTNLCKKNKNTPFDLRLHRAISRQSGHVEGEEPYERSICWFFNSERAPAPGLVVISYLGSPHVPRPQKRSHTTNASITRSTNKVTEETPTGSIEEVDDESDESPPPTKRRREDADWAPSLKVAESAGNDLTRSTYNLKSRTTTPVVVLSDSEPDSSEDRDGKCSRSTSNKRARLSSSAFESLAAGKRQRNSGRVPTASSATTTHKYAYIRSTRSKYMKLRRARTLRSQSAKAANRTIRLLAGQKHFFAQKTSLEATRTRKADKPEHGDQMLRHEKMASSSSKQNGSQLILPMLQLRALAADMFFASVPDLSSILFVHSLLQPDVDKLTLEQASVSKAPTSKPKEKQLCASEINKSNVPEMHKLCVREFPLRSILADAANIHMWSAERVSELVPEVLRDVGADEATVASVRVGFAREAIDGCALTRLGQQDLSQRFGVPFGVALRLLSSVLSHLSSASIRSHSESSLIAADAAVCGTSEAVISSKGVSDASMVLKTPADTSNVKSVPDGVALVSFPMC